VQCNSDCDGTFDDCTTECETASERVWRQTAPQSGDGAGCPPRMACEPGDDRCPFNCILPDPDDGTLGNCPSNGILDHGSSCTLLCDQGHELQEIKTFTCDNGTLSAPTCLSCDHNKYKDTSSSDSCIVCSNNMKPNEDKTDCVDCETPSQYGIDGTCEACIPFDVTNFDSIVLTQESDVTKCVNELQLNSDENCYVECISNHIPSVSDPRGLLSIKCNSNYEWEMEGTCERQETCVDYECGIGTHTIDPNPEELFCEGVTCITELSSSDYHRCCTVPPDVELSVTEFDVHVEGTNKSCGNRFGSGMGEVPFDCAVLGKANKNVETYDVTTKEWNTHINWEDLNCDVECTPQKCCDEIRDSEDNIYLGGESMVEHCPDKTVEITSELNDISSRYCLNTICPWRACKLKNGNKYMYDDVNNTCINISDSNDVQEIATCNYDINDDLTQCGIEDWSEQSPEKQYIEKYIHDWILHDPELFETLITTTGPDLQGNNWNPFDDETNKITHYCQGLDQADCTSVEVDENFSFYNIKLEEIHQDQSLQRKMRGLKSDDSPMAFSEWYLPPVMNYLQAMVHLDRKINGTPAPAAVGSLTPEELENEIFVNFQDLRHPCDAECKSTIHDYNSGTNIQLDNLYEISKHKVHAGCIVDKSASCWTDEASSCETLSNSCAAIQDPTVCDSTPSCTYYNGELPSWGTYENISKIEDCNTSTNQPISIHSLNDIFSEVDYQSKYCTRMVLKHCPIDTIPDHQTIPLQEVPSLLDDSNQISWDTPAEHFSSTPLDTLLCPQLETELRKIREEMILKGADFTSSPILPRCDKTKDLLNQSDYDMLQTASIDASAR
tara:strand:- start:1241 stop:3760 length:2520 start_codon:yes stop_codon:yes gene_type:complete